MTERKYRIDDFTLSKMKEVLIENPYIKENQQALFIDGIFYKSIFEAGQESGISYQWLCKCIKTTLGSPFIIQDELVILYNDVKELKERILDHNEDIYIYVLEKLHTTKNERKKEKYNIFLSACTPLAAQYLEITGNKQDLIDTCTLYNLFNLSSAMFSKNYFTRTFSKIFNVNTVIIKSHNYYEGIKLKEKIIS